jgi:3-dehydroquinate dehydratase-1
MKLPKICAVITHSDMAAIEDAANLADLFEVRIDLVGHTWPEIVRHIKKPWIATNRSGTEGGKWQESEARRKEELLKALQMGADIIDVELSMPNLDKFVPIIKKSAKCLVSYHDLQGTPPSGRLNKIVLAEQAAGADICKVATTAQTFEDNLAILRLINAFPKTRVVALAMGLEGQTSRLLCPLVGGEFTYAAIKGGQESACGQIPLAELHQLYRMISSG